MVEFVVRVPDDTPPDCRVYLAGDGPALGEWFADRVALDLSEDGTHRARLDIPTGFRGKYLVTPGRWRDAEGDGRGRELPARDLHVTGAGTVEAHVAGWGRGAVRHHHDFASRFLPHSRTLTVWLPSGYDLEPERRFPVLYMQDGQNLFDPETAFAGHPWRADEVTEREVRAGRVRPLILVGIANTVDRIREYGPRRSAEDGDLARAYGRFVVEEVMPFIDSTYRTLPDAENTGVGGSSMGGLISLYLCHWNPDAFGRCAALSPSLWWDRESFLHTAAESPEWPGRCRVWADMGTREGSTEAGMRSTARRVRRLATIFRRRGLRAGEQFHVEEVEGALHNEAAWGGRFDRVLRFLFGTEDHPNRPVM